MALVHEFERSGNWLFKRRSWLPAAFIVIGIIVLYLTNRQAIIFNPTAELIFLGVSLLGEAIRILYRRICSKKHLRAKHSCRSDSR